MAGVANDEADVLLFGKFDGCSDVGGRINIDSVANISANSARLRSIIKRVAASIRKELIQCRRRRLDADGN